MAESLNRNMESGSYEPGGKATGSGASVEVTAAAAMNGSSYGAEFTMSGSSSAYLSWDSSTGLGEMTQTAFRARIYLDINTWTNTDTDSARGPLELLAFPNTVFRFETEENSGTVSINGYYRDNAGVNKMTTETTITSGPHWLECEYIYGSGDGVARWWLDGSLQQEATTLTNNSVGSVDAVFAGWQSMGAGGGGSAYIDGIIVNDDGAAIGETYSALLRAGRTKLHSVNFSSPASNSSSVELYDSADASGSPKLILKAPASTSRTENFGGSIRMEDGLSVRVVGVSRPGVRVTHSEDT